MAISKIGTNSLGNVTDISSSTTLSLKTAGTTAVTVDASQNVGIGTSSPTAKIEAYGTDAGIICHYDTQSRGGIYALSSQRLAISTTASSDDIVFGNGNTSAGFLEKMRIDNSTGSVTMPYQPTFFVRKTNGGAMAPVNPVLFNDVVTNIGSYYNASTGRFTAPVAGSYYFISSGHMETTNNLARALKFYKNGGEVSYAYALNATGSRGIIMNVAILTLAANDYITIGTETSDIWAGDSSGINFTGFLIG